MSVTVRYATGIWPRGAVDRACGGATAYQSYANWRAFTEFYCCAFTSNRLLAL